MKKLLLCFVLFWACAPAMVAHTPDPPSTGFRLIGKIETWVNGVRVAALEGACSAGLRVWECGAGFELGPDDKEEP